MQRAGMRLPRGLHSGCYIPGKLYVKYGTMGRGTSSIHPFQLGSTGAAFWRGGGASHLRTREACWWLLDSTCASGFDRLSAPQLRRLEAGLGGASHSPTHRSCKMTESSRPYSESMSWNVFLLEHSVAHRSGHLPQCPEGCVSCAMHEDWSSRVAVGAPFGGGEGALEGGEVVSRLARPLAILLDSASGLHAMGEWMDAMWEAQARGMMSLSLPLKECKPGAQRMFVPVAKAAVPPTKPPGSRRRNDARP